MAETTLETVQRKITEYGPSAIRWLYRGFHGANFALVYYAWLTNPEARDSEYLPDMWLHLWEALCPNYMNELAQFAHSVRAAQATYGLFTGDSSVPGPLNGFDALTHLGAEESHRNEWFAP